MIALSVAGGWVGNRDHWHGRQARHLGGDAAEQQPAQLRSGRRRRADERRVVSLALGHDAVRRIERIENPFPGNRVQRIERDGPEEQIAYERQILLSSSRAQVEVTDVAEQARIAAENAALRAAAAGGVEVTILRPADVYGPGSRPWTVLPVRNLRAGRVVLPAFGQGVFDPVYIDDVVAAVAAAGERAEAAGRGDRGGLKQLFDCLAMEVQLCNQIGFSKVMKFYFIMQDTFIKET